MSKQPPQPKKIKTVFTEHGQERVDHYHWMQDRDNPEVIQYLEEENAYCEEVMSGVEDLKEEIFEEIKSRIRQEDESVPYYKNGFYYFHRYQKDQQYPVYLRYKEKKAEAEILIDVNELAKGQAFCQVGALKVSPDNTIMALAVDFVGRRQYDILFKDLRTGAMFEDRIEHCSPSMEWSGDNTTLFYLEKDKKTLKPDRLKKHILGQSTDTDPLLYHETDEQSRCYLFSTQSDKYLVLGSTAKTSDEYRFISKKEAQNTAWELFLPREKDHEYHIDHLDGQWYILSNKNAKDFKLASCTEDNRSTAEWKELLPTRKGVLLEDFELFHDRIVLEERSNGMKKLLLLDRQEPTHSNHIEFDEEFYIAEIGPNTDPAASQLRLNYISMTTPERVYDFDFEKKELVLRKEKSPEGEFDRNHYVSSRLMITARDETPIPISILHHKDTVPGKDAPLLLYGYGSYGITVDPEFRQHRLSLLDRGFVFAIAHIRGGQFYGRQWYEDGKMLNKKNSFNDFVDCGRALIEKGMAEQRKLFAMGGSAGGLLVGAVINQAPDLFHGVVAAVPFVDVVSTMLDDSVPLTTEEYEEWGNPNNPEYYRYMLSYSPYDNVVEANYPHVLITSGLHDSQVQFWEPTKWAAKLRAYNQGDHKILLHTNMEAGHGGASGRFDVYKEVAMEYAFLIMLSGPDVDDLIEDLGALDL